RMLSPSRLDDVPPARLLGRHARHAGFFSSARDAHKQGGKPVSSDLSSREEVRFREEIREFVANEVASEIQLKVAQGREISRDETFAWQRKLVAHGWGAVHWPKRWGGTDWSLEKRFVFEEEMALAGAPQIPPFNTRMLGPILLEYGSEEQ